MIKVPDFTKDEINYILDKANFTDQQRTLFLLRNQEYSYEMCAEEMNVSIATVKRIAKIMNEKIRKVM